MLPQTATRSAFLCAQSMERGADNNFVEDTWNPFLNERRKNRPRDSSSSRSAGWLCCRTIQSLVNVCSDRKPDHPDLG